MKFLNVGGGSKHIQVPPRFDGWEHVLLDIDKKAGVDLAMDARALSTLPAGQYDAVYCSHNLEHYYSHDVLMVLKGFLHVLKPGGFCEIRVPDMEALFKLVVSHGLNMSSVVYESGMGPIRVHDIIYGFGSEIKSSGNDFYAHKSGFMENNLIALLKHVGFVDVKVQEPISILEIHVIAKKA